MGKDGGICDYRNIWFLKSMEWSAAKASHYAKYRITSGLNSGKEQRLAVYSNMSTSNQTLDERLSSLTVFPAFIKCESQLSSTQISTDVSESFQKVAQLSISQETEVENY